jgi:hypothetical protein
LLPFVKNHFSVFSGSPSPTAPDLRLAVFFLEPLIPSVLIAVRVSAAIGLSILPESPAAREIGRARMYDRPSVDWQRPFSKGAAFWGTRRVFYENLLIRWRSSRWFVSLMFQTFAMVSGARVAVAEDF